MIFFSPRFARFMRKTYAQFDARDVSRIPLSAMLEFCVLFVQFGSVHLESNNDICLWFIISEKFITFKKWVVKSDKRQDANLRFVYRLQWEFPRKDNNVNHVSCVVKYVVFSVTNFENECVYFIFILEMLTTLNGTLI